MQQVVDDYGFDLWLTSSDQAITMKLQEETPSDRVYNFLNDFGLLKLRRHHRKFIKIMTKASLDDFLRYTDEINRSLTGNYLAEYSSAFVNLQTEETDFWKQTSQIFDQLNNLADRASFLTCLINYFNIYQHFNLVTASILQKYLNDEQLDLGKINQIINQQSLTDDSLASRLGWNLANQVLDLRLMAITNGVNYVGQPRINRQLERELGDNWTIVKVCLATDYRPFSPTKLALIKFIEAKSQVNQDVLEVIGEDLSVNSTAVYQKSVMTIDIQKLSAQFDLSDALLIVNYYRRIRKQQIDKFLYMYLNWLKQLSVDQVHCSTSKVISQSAPAC